jgi:hypothetical protein
MNIYNPMVSDGYEWVHTINDSDYETFLSFDGQPRIATWKPIKVRRVVADEVHALEESDFPWLGSDALVMRSSAVDALRDILEANGELLPLSTDDGVSLYVFNAQVVNALDEERSHLIKFPGSDRIMHIRKLELFASAIRGIDSFRLPHRASSTYVSDRFVERVNTARLHGLDFNICWSA